MAKVSSNASDKQHDALETVETTLSTISITTSPVVITAVQRKANIGNFETIDIFMGVALPDNQVDILDKEALNEALHSAAELGFSVVSRETAQRYHQVKDSLK